MNFFEEITLPFYSWYRSKGNSRNLCVFHCRFVISEILFFLFLDTCLFCCLIFNKLVFFLNRFLFDKKIEYLLGIVIFLLTLTFTSSKNWEKAYVDGDQRFDFWDYMLIGLLPGIIFIILVSVIKR